MSSEKKSVDKGASEEPFVPKLTPREIIAQKKAAKLLEDEKNLTFKPKIKPKVTKAADSGDAVEPVSVFNKLYVSTKKPASPTTTETTKAAPTKVATAASINRLHGGVSTRSPKAVPTEESPSKPKKIVKNTAEVSQRLYQEADKIRAKLENSKNKVEEDYAKKYTFKPALNKNSPVASGKGNIDSSATMQDRMAKYSEEKAKRLEEARKALEAEQAKDLTFKPAMITPKKDKEHPTGVSGTSASGGSARKSVPVESPSFKPNLATKNSYKYEKKGESNTSVHERLFIMHKEELVKQEELRKLKQEEELSKTCTFSPSILSVPAGQHAPSSEKVFDRLSHVTKHDYTEEKMKYELDGCTFHPHVEWASNAKTSKPVHDRLSEEAKKLKLLEAQRAEHKKQRELHGATFAPTIPETSAKLAKKREEEQLLKMSSSSGNDEAHDDNESVASTVVPEDPNGEKIVSMEALLAGSEKGLHVIGSAATISPSKAAPAEEEETVPEDPNGEKIVSMEALLAGSEKGLHVIGSAATISPSKAAPAEEEETVPEDVGVSTAVQLDTAASVDGNDNGDQADPVAESVAVEEPVN